MSMSPNKKNIEMSPTQAAEKPQTLATKTRTVCLFETDANASALTHKLQALGYATIDGTRNGVPKNCVSVIVNAEIDTDLKIATSLSGDHRVVLLSNDRSFDFRVAAARAGVEAVLWGPLDTVELGAWLTDFDLEEQSAPTVLIVDDDELAAGAYAMALERAGMRAHVVNDATKAVLAVDQLAPNLVLMDMNMPDANGLEVAQVLRQSRKNLSLPIIFLSAEKDAARQHLARRIGGDDFISKPVSLENLVNLVEIRAERARSLRQVMERDSLTGLLNHARFKERLTAEMDRSRRTKSPLTTCLIDLDHFKKVNDTHGHQAGDRVIQTLAHTLRGALRHTDIVARYGGEEFATILLDTCADDAQRTMDKIRKSFAKIDFEAGGEKFNVTLSGGVAEFNASSTTEKLIGNADEALYRAKENGRDRIVLEGE